MFKNKNKKIILKFMTLYPVCVNASQAFLLSASCPSTEEDSSLPMVYFHGTQTCISGSLWARARIWCFSRRYVLTTSGFSQVLWIWTPILIPLLGAIPSCSASK